MSRSLARNVFIDALPDAVWHAWTAPGELACWFPVDARVTPGTGGSIALSWGDSFEGSAPITVWEPDRWLQWQDRQDSHTLTVDVHLDARAGCTAVRLVESGFGDGAEWDEEYEMSGGNWSYFLQHLKWYIERHHQAPRQLTAWRDAVPLDRREAFLRLLGASALSTDGRLATLAAGEPYAATTSQGDTISGVVVSRCEKSHQIGLTIQELSDAILLVEVEPDPLGSRAGFWLSTYGLDPKKLAAVRKSYGQMYRRALGASLT
jgi:uncharacterized protein YndB with AHSA1/START domain